MTYANHFGPSGIIIVLAALFLGLSACAEDFAGETEAYYNCAEPDSVSTIEHTQAAEYQAFLDDMVRGNMPGAALWVRSADGQIWAGASGKADMASGVDMQSCNLSRGASITKTFVAVLIMMLVEQGALDLDDRIAEHLPASLLLDIANGEVATVRQMLNHTSGIPDYTDIGFLLEQLNDSTTTYSMEEHLDVVRGKSADFAPGQGWTYSNTNYELAGFLIEEVSGQPFEVMLRERILTPLAMEQTHINLDGTTPPGTVRGYMDINGNGLVFDASDYALGHGSTAGAIVSTIFDLAIFVEALFAAELISEQSLDQMQQWQETAPEGNESEFLYGLGLMRDESEYGAAMGHTGGMFGASSAMFHIPETEVTAVVLVNGGAGKISNAFGNELLPNLYEILHEGF